MKIASWNINGIRAIWEKDFKSILRNIDADVFCVQEVREHKDLDRFHIALYDEYFYPSNVKGYAGVGIYTRIEPVSVTVGMGIKEHDNDGRVMTMEFADMYVVCVYAPASGVRLERLDYRLRWQIDFNQYVAYLQRKKPVLICGDLNVVPDNLDAPFNVNNMTGACFTIEERDLYRALECQGLIDAWRAMNQNKRSYTWWPQGTVVRSGSEGLRLDYFLVDERIAGRVTESEIMQSIKGSDHCPITISLQ